MDAKLQRRVQRYGWDAAAGAYDAGWGDGLRSAHDALLDVADLSPGMSVLETACGTGLVTLRAAAAVHPDGSVMATDISGVMVEVASRRVRHEGYDYVQVARMDAENLEVDGVPCKATGSQSVSLHENGRLRKCRLSEAATIQGRAFQEGEDITLDEEGQLIE